MSHVLIVDDEPAICWAFREALTDEGHRVTVASSAEEALQLAGGGLKPDAVVMDVRLPGADGLSTLQPLRKWIGATPVIVITAFGNLETAVRAVELGAFDYLLKPFDLDQATTVVRRALEMSQVSSTELDQDTESRLPTDTIIGTSPAMQNVFKQIALVARSDVSVLITGESGTGKELVARAIHRHSSRQQGPFLAVCMPALSPGVIESELFGHVKGAFTGATTDRVGWLELGHGGTVLLDEIADIPPAVQVKLLRAIEQREVIPVGDVQPRPLNLRVLAATNRPLAQLIATGQFREDLYFRLRVFQIHLPPLRERREDIPLLADYFIRQTQQGIAETTLRLSAAARQELCARPWPGNVRELRNTMEHAVIMARQGEILPEHLPAATHLPLETPALAPAPSTVEEWGQQIHASLLSWTAGAAQSAALSATGEGELYEEFLKLTEPALLEAVLKHCHQNRAAAAQLLGLHRATLRHKLRRYGLG